MMELALLIGLAVLGVIIVGYVKHDATEEKHRLMMRVEELERDMNEAVFLTPEQRVLFSAAEEAFSLAQVIEKGQAQWYVVNRSTGRRLFEVDEDTLTVIPLQERSAKRRSS
jgi:hypothetical protein